MLLLYNDNLQMTDISIIAEVAYCNEDLDLTIGESVFWKTKGSDRDCRTTNFLAKASMTIKIDNRVKQKRKVDWLWRQGQTDHSNRFYQICSGRTYRYRKHD